MPDDAYFDDSSDDAKPEMESEGKSEATALLPKEFFGSKELEIGTECKVKVEKILDDEVQVSYVPHKEKEDEAMEEGAEMAVEDMEMMEDMA